MTIGYVLDDTLDRQDGVQQAVLSIGEHMRQLGHDVHYIVAETKRTDIPNIHSIGRYMSFQFNGNSVRTPFPISKKAVQKLFTDVQFDVLHVQMPFSPLLAGRVLKAAPQSVRKVGTFHILPYNTLSRVGTHLIGLLTRSVVKRLDICYAVSEPAREFMQKSYKRKPEVLPNPIDYNFFSSFKKIKHAKVQIVFVGRFDVRKGVRELIEAYSLLDNDLKQSTQLTMVGTGPLFEQVKARANALGIAATFPGFVDNDQKAQYLVDADIAVFPSISGESFGIVLAEAMAAGSGVTLGGDNPGYASVLQEWPEVLFNPKDIKAFSETLTHFLTNQSDAQRVGVAQHARVKAYDITVITDRLISEAYSEQRIR